MGRVLLAFRCFFGILFHGRLSEETILTLGLSAAPAQPQAEAAPAAPPPKITLSDGALHMLSILQRDSRLIDFLMEDIAAYSDEQIGAAVRTLHDQCRDSLSHYVRLVPVIDGVEGSFTSVSAAGTRIEDGATVKFLGNVPAKGVPSGGLLRHKGWRAEKVDLPPVVGQQSAAIIAPAEIEVE